MPIKFIRTNTEYIEELIKNIHPDIKKEVEFLSRQSYELGIRATIKNADESWTICSDDGVLGIFGINKVNLLSDTAAPWLLTTYKIRKHVKTLLPLTKIALQYWLKKYKCLENYIPINYEASVRWLTWAGFKIKPYNNLLYKIEMRS